MLFRLKVALRYLFSNPGQTLLLIAGIMLGVIAYVYITSLIGGLRVRQVTLTTGNIAHVELEPRERIPAMLYDGPETVMSAVQRTTAGREQIREWTGFVERLERMPGITAVSPQITGSGFLLRAQSVKALSITGVMPDKLSDIVKIEENLVDGVARLDLSSALIGSKLAENLGIRVGQTIRIRSERQVELLLTVRGIFKTGLSSFDDRAVFMHIQRARALMDLPFGISEILVKVTDMDDAEAWASRLSAETGLKATSWIESNQRLFDALNAQKRSGSIIQGFSLLTILIGVSSALLLSAYRRRSEIGIMRAMGLSRGFVAAVFVTQGALVGILGAGAGITSGYYLVSLATKLGVRADGTPLLPIDPAQGGYATIFMLTVMGSMLASLIPARMASKVDPLEAIGG